MKPIIRNKMHVRQIDIPNLNDYVKLSPKQKEDIQEALAFYYGMLKQKSRYKLTVVEMIKEDLIDLEKKEAYEACKLYLDTIDYIERVLREELQQYYNNGTKNM